jgi:cytochrome P450 family 6
MQYQFQNDLLTGSPVGVTEMMYRYTTDVIASCAFGINGNSLKDPQSEFRMFLRNIFDFSVVKSFAALAGFTAPAIKKLFKMKYLDDDTTNYLRKTVWSTVEYR